MNKRFELILTNANGEILDLGSTNSDNEENVHSLLLKKTNTVYSCDKYGDPYYKIDLNDSIWNIDKKFDTIIAGEIIEHVKDPINFLTNCYSLLKDNGVLVLTTPNASSLSYMVNPEWCVGSKEEIWHIHCFTSGMLKLLAEHIGFKNTNVTYVSCANNALSKIIGFFIPRLRRDLVLIATK